MDTVFDRSTILVVDDDRDIVTVISSALNDAFPCLRILRAFDGQECVDFFGDRKPNPGIVILDMMLPKRSGFLVMEKIKRGRLARDQMPVIIMITGNLSSRHKMYAESLGTFKYFTKPFRMQVIVEAVREAQAKLIV